MEKDPALIKEIKSAGMDIHHHGANRPPGKWLVERLKGKSWDEEVKIVLNYMTHDIDVETEEILPRPGGLKRMKKILSLDFFATGRFFEAPILYGTKRLGAKMCVGVKGNLGAERVIEEYKGKEPFFMVARVHEHDFFLKREGTTPGPPYGERIRESFLKLREDPFWVEETKSFSPQNYKRRYGRSTRRL